MRPKGAAPGSATDPGREDFTKRNTRSIPLSAVDLPPTVIKRLAGKDVHACQYWRRLSRTEERAIWGVTKACVRVIDQFVEVEVKRASQAVRS